jgi:hypothetical protein
MRKSSLVAVLVVGALLVPLAVFASHQFNDVPTGHTFHNAIDWMKDNNITVGCNPPGNTNYCPDDNVTRGEMAAFLKRLAENNVVDAATLDGIDSSGLETVVNGVADDFYVGAVRTLNGRLKLLDLAVDAPVAGTSIVSGTASAYLSGVQEDHFGAWVQLDNSTCELFQEAIPGARGWGTVAGSAAVTYDTVSFTAAVALSAGSHTLTLCAESFGGNSITLIDSSLTSVFSASGSVVAPQGVVTGGSEAPGQ